MTDKSSLQFTDRLSIVLASVAGLLIIIYSLPAQGTAINRSFIGIMLRVDLMDVVPVLYGLLAFVGTLWVMNTPWRRSIDNSSSWPLIRSAVIPTLTVFVLSISLRQMTRNSLWWVILGFGVFLLGMVIVAEFNVTVSSDPRRIPASIGLIALSHSLFLMLGISMSVARVRLFAQIPLLFLGSAFVGYRSLSLRTRVTPTLPWLVAIPVIVTQIGVVLNYFYIDAITFGLLTTGCLYALGAFAQGLMQNARKWQLMAEPLAMSAATIALVILFAVF